MKLNHRDKKYLGIFLVLLIIELILFTNNLPYKIVLFFQTFLIIITLCTSIADAFIWIYVSNKNTNDILHGLLITLIAITGILSFFTILKSNADEPVYSAHADFSMEIVSKEIKNGEKVGLGISLVKDNILYRVMSAGMSLNSSNDSVHHIQINFDKLPEISKEVKVKTFNESDNIVFTLSMLDSNIRIVKGNCTFIINGEVTMVVDIPEQKADRFLIYSDPSRKVNWSKIKLSEK